MKKFALVFLAGISLASAKAQVQFGVKAGANFASVTNADGGKTLTSFHAGALVNLTLADALSLQPEAVYSMQGIKGDGGKLQFNYINIPVLLKYKLPVGVFFETGPQLGILASAKSKPDEGESVSVKDGCKSIDFGWALGAGYQIPDVNLGIDVRYNLGLTKIGKEVDGVNVFDGKNKVFQVGIFYLFGGTSGKAKK